MKFVGLQKTQLPYKLLNLMVRRFSHAFSAALYVIRFLLLIYNYITTEMNLVYKNKTTFILKWMNSRTMVAIDTSERAHVIDVRSEEELEVIDLVDVQLAYSTSFYKSLATGGNVSQALVCFNLFNYASI